jgi:hypothetical protein
MTGARWRGSVLGLAATLVALLGGGVGPAFPQEPPADGSRRPWSDYTGPASICTHAIGGQDGVAVLVLWQ